MALSQQNSFSYLRRADPGTMRLRALVEELLGREDLLTHPNS